MVLQLSPIRPKPSAGICGPSLPNGRVFTVFGIPGVRSYYRRRKEMGGGGIKLVSIYMKSSRGSKSWKGACLAVQCLANADPSGVVGCGESVRLPCLTSAVALHYKFAKAFMMLHVASLDLPSKQLVLSSNSGLRNQDISKGLRFRCICIRSVTLFGSYTILLSLPLRDLFDLPQGHQTLTSSIQFDVLSGLPLDQGHSVVDGQYDAIDSGVTSAKVVEFMQSFPTFRPVRPDLS